MINFKTFVSLIVLAFAVTGCSNFITPAASAEVENARIQRKKTIEEVFAEKNLIFKPVLGLYESIPDSKVLDFGNDFQHEVSQTEFQNLWKSVLTSKKTNQMAGTLSRKYNNDKNSIDFVHAKLFEDAAPSFLTCLGCKNLVAGRGTPTVVLQNLHMFRYIGVKYASLLSAQSDIINEESVMDFLFHPLIIDSIKLKKTESLSEIDIHNALIETPSLKYLSTVLIQSGHKIVDVNFEVAWTNYEDVDEFSEQYAPRLVEAFGADISAYAIPLGFEIEFKLSSALN